MTPRNPATSDTRVQTFAPVNQVFLDNMRQLWRQNPRLAQRVDEVPMETTLDVVASKTGPATARVRTTDERTLYLHSRYDPRREAAEFCESLDKSDATLFVLSGLGLGYHVKALGKVFGDQIVIIVTEPDLVTIKTCLEHTDLSNELATGRVLFVTELDKAALHEQLGRHSTMLMLGTCFVVPPVARDHQADFHNACRKAITDYAAFARMSLVTLVKNSAITCRNVANNLPTYVSTPSIDILRRRFSGCPAILVAAGPSLARNIDQLTTLQDRAVIIAAQTTLRPLLARGIRPHFATSLDFSNLSRQFFEGVDLPEDLVLIAEPKASCNVVDTFRGTAALAGRRAILLDNDFAHLCLGDDLARRTPLEAGATVMHLAFYLACWLGCDPVIFVGQDLGFTGHCYYTPGVAMHRAWRPELGRFGTLEMKEWERIARHRPILRKMTDVFGRDIYSDDQMFTYLQQFERDFARSAVEVIDATEGGVRKSGACVRSLSETADRYCRQTIPSSCWSFLKRAWYDTSRTAAARTVLAERRDELETFRSLCLETRDVLNELETKVADPAAFNRRMVRVDELRTMAQAHGIVFRMVGSVSQLGELQKFSADRRIVMDGVRGADRARRQLQRDRRFIDALLNGCDELAAILDESLRRFDQAMEASA